MVYTVCHSARIFWTHYSRATLFKFQDKETNFSGVRIFRNFTVFQDNGKVIMNALCSDVPLGFGKSLVSSGIIQLRNCIIQCQKIF